MASIHLDPLLSIKFMNLDNRLHWRKPFHCFRVSSGLYGEGFAKQVNTLLYCLGKEFEVLFDPTIPTKEESKGCDTVIAKFDIYFQIERNVIFEQAQFKWRYQIESKILDNTSWS